jgi:hypothetical protein
MPKLPIAPRLIIFDFDGVILESNAIKDRAFTLSICLIAKRPLLLTNYFAPTPGFPSP